MVPSPMYMVFLSVKFLCCAHSHCAENEPGAGMPGFHALRPIARAGGDRYQVSVARARLAPAMALRSP